MRDASRSSIKISGVLKRKRWKRWGWGRGSRKRTGRLHSDDSGSRRAAISSSVIRELKDEEGVRTPRWSNEDRVLDAFRDTRLWTRSSLGGCDVISLWRNLLIIWLRSASWLVNLSDEVDGDVMKEVMTSLTALFVSCEYERGSVKEHQNWEWCRIHQNPLDHHLPLNLILRCRGSCDVIKEPLTTDLATCGPIRPFFGYVPIRLWRHQQWMGQKSRLPKSQEIGCS